MKPQMTTETPNVKEPFLVEFSETIPAAAVSNDTKLTEVDTETTDDD